MSAIVTNAESSIGLAVIRSLGRNNVDATVASCEEHAISFHSKYCKEKIIYPQISNKNKFIKSLEVIVKKGNYDVLFPIREDIIPIISYHRDRFKKYTKIPLVEHEKLNIAFDKSETLKIAMQNNIPHPKTYFVESVKEVKKIGNKLEYPVVIKPRISSGSKGLYYVTSPKELVNRYAEISKEHKNPIIQECISLNGEAYGVEALFNKDSKPRATFVHKRIRQYPITGGPSTLRESIKNEEVEKLGIKLLKALGWYGVAMVEFKIDPRDNKPKLMEINPRFWGSLPLSIASGVDFPYLLYRMALDGDIKKVSNYKIGVKSRLLFADMRYFGSIIQDDYTHLGIEKPDRFKTFLEFMKFYERDLHYDILSFDDFDPFMSEIKRILMRKVKNR